MQFIREYESSSSSSSETELLGSRDLRQIYLITYSQPNLQKFPTRKSFAETIVKSFTTTTNSVVQWCCAKRPTNAPGSLSHGDQAKRDQTLVALTKYLIDKYGISVHFSSVYANYYTAWKYGTKEDAQYEESEGHPDLSPCPSTIRAHEALQKRRNSRHK